MAKQYDPVLVSIGRKIIERREAIGMTATELAILADVTASSSPSTNRVRDPWEWTSSTGLQAPSEYRCRIFRMRNWTRFRIIPLNYIL